MLEQAHGLNVRLRVIAVGADLVVERQGGDLEARPVEPVAEAQRLVLRCPEWRDAERERDQAADQQAGRSDGAAGHGRIAPPKPDGPDAWWGAVDERRHPSLQGAGKATRFRTWAAVFAWLLQLGPTNPGNRRTAAQAS